MKHVVVSVTYEGFAGAVLMHALGGGKMEKKSPSNFVIELLKGEDIEAVDVQELVNLLKKKLVVEDAHSLLLDAPENDRNMYHVLAE
jgi:hypothetical protein